MYTIIKYNLLTQFFKHFGHWGGWHCIFFIILRLKAIIAFSKTILLNVILNISFITFMYKHF